MHGNCVNQTIFKDTELYYFYANTYDEDYYFTIDRCDHCIDTLQDNEYIIIPSKPVQISEHYV